MPFCASSIAFSTAFTGSLTVITSGRISHLTKEINGFFFFNAKDNDNLDPGRHWGYAVFGMVVEGQEVIDAMAVVATHVDKGTGYPNTPIEAVVLKRASILPEPNYN